MSGCPFLKYDWNKNCETCKLTDKPTNGALLCDFDYDTDCAIYQKQATEQKLNPAGLNK